jgi:hypothetical protein
VSYVYKSQSEHGRVDSLAGYVAEVVKGLSNRDLQNFSEKSLKMIFMTLLTGTNAYYVQSEAETGRGYADLYIKRAGINPGKFDFLIELKYVKVSDSASVNSVREMGLEQLRNYASSMDVSVRESVKFCLVIFSGKSNSELIVLDDLI